MEEHVVVIGYKELRQEDLAVGVRVHITWDPCDCKEEAVGIITEIRRWEKTYYLADQSPYDIVVRLVDEVTGMRREASMEDQWIDVIAPRE